MLFHSLDLIIISLYLLSTVAIGIILKKSWYDKLKNLKYCFFGK